MRQDNTIHTFSIKLSFSSIGQDKSKLQKQISKLLILIEMAGQAAVAIKKVIYLFVSVALICLVLYLRKIVLSKMCISYNTYCLLIK